MENLPKNIALVYDHVNKWGGAESVLLALHQLFPQAPLYTSVYNSKAAPWASVFSQVIPTFLNKLSSRHEFMPFLTPISFETFDFSKYDAVISVTSADAKGIVTKPQTFHFCYCLTPNRYLWSHHLEYKSQISPLLRLFSMPIFKYLKYWDKVAAHRPDTFVSISGTVARRIRKYHQIDSEVIYPPVNLAPFSNNYPKPNEKDYFLYVGRLVSYKHPELIVKIFNDLGLPLVVVGTGHLEKKLKSLANKNIIFAGFVSDSVKISYLQNCKALLSLHEEDFGIVPIEAMACGKPVIALNAGGVSETVVHNKTGILVDSLDIVYLKDVISSFSVEKFDSIIIKKHAQKFSQEKFFEKFAKVFTNQWKTYRNIYMS